MKNICCLLSAAGILFSCSQSDDRSDIRSEIEKVNKQFMDAVAAKNADDVAALYSENARLMFPHMPPVEGRKNIKEFFQQAIQSGITDVKLTTEEVAGADDFAVETGRFEMMADGKKVDEGKYIVQWKKVGNRWYLHRDMPNTDLASPQSIAKPGQTVGIAVFKVEDANSKKFETFVNDVLMPATDSSTPAKSAAVKAVRFLKGNEVAKDGTRTYIFIFDPRSDEMEYGIRKILVAKHGPEKGQSLDQEFGSLVTSYYEYHDMQQLAASQIEN